MQGEMGDMTEAARRRAAALAAENEGGSETPPYLASTRRMPFMSAAWPGKLQMKS
jgi:hypothetical protein